MTLRALCCAGRPGAGNDHTDDLLWGLVAVLVVVVIVGYVAFQWWVRRR
jgi:hypothetical protein